MGRIQFLMDTSGHCFVCLKLTPSPKITAGQHDPRTFSFRNICDFLQINLWEVSKEAMPLNSGNVPMLLEKSDLKGVLCEECSPAFEGFSNQFLELERIKMKLQYSLKLIYDKMMAIEKCEGKTTAKFERELLLRKQTALRSGFVEQLRRKTLERCSTVIETGHPLFTSKGAEVFVEQAIHEVELGSENQIGQEEHHHQQDDDDIIFLSSFPASPKSATMEKFGHPSSQLTDNNPGSFETEEARILQNHSPNIPIFEQLPVTLSGKSPQQPKKAVAKRGLKQFKCSFCPKKFSISFIRNRHMQNCSARSGQGGGVNFNEPNPSNDPSSPGTGLKSYKCFVCHKTFPNELDAHPHGRKKLCPPCHLKFSQNAPKIRRKPAPPRRYGWDDQPFPLPRRETVTVIEDAVGVKATQSKRTQSPPESPKGLNWKAAISQNRRAKPSKITTSEGSIRQDVSLPISNDEQLVTTAPDSQVKSMKGKAAFPQTCKICNKQFHSKRMMSRHLTKCRKANRQAVQPQLQQQPLQCQFCPKVFSSISNRNHHMRTACPNGKKGPEGSTTTKITNKAVTKRRTPGTPSQNETPTFADEEMEADSWQIEVECAVCQEKVNEPATHKCTHLETTLKFNDQGEVVGEEVIPKLPLLTIPQPSPSTKPPQSSINRTTGGTKCGVCSKEFPRKSVFLNHYMSSHLNSTFICNLDLCGKEFYHRSDYTRHHRETHMGIKFKCDCCDKMFSQRERFLEHRQNVHFPEGYKLDEQSPPPSAPPTAPATLSNTEEGNDAEAGIPQGGINPENGKHKCSLCPSEFQYKKRYEEHYKNFHLTGRLHCKPCGREFSEGERADFQRHVDKEHRGVSFRCKICDKVFSHKSNLGAHRQSIHFGRKMDCPGCLRTFSSSANRRQHMRLNRCGKSRPSHLAYTKI